MILALNIQTETPEELLDVLRRLGVGGEPRTATLDPQPAAARKPRETKTETAPATAQPTPAASSATVVSTASAPTPEPAAPATASAPPADVPITEADLIAAANAAVGALGPAGAAKVKEYIGLHFKKADGTPGTLKMTAPDQHPALLKALQGIAQKTITL